MYPLTTYQLKVKDYYKLIIRKTMVILNRHGILPIVRSCLSSFSLFDVLLCKWVQNFCEIMTRLSRLTTKNSMSAFGLSFVRWDSELSPAETRSMAAFLLSLSQKGIANRALGMLFGMLLYRSSDAFTFGLFGAACVGKKIK